MKKHRKLLPLLLAACMLLSSSCGVLSESIIPEPEEGVLIYAALNPITDTLEKSVARFNEKHDDVQIEIRDYSDEEGPQRLMVELAAGRVPDIMELRRIGYEWWANTGQMEEVMKWDSTPMTADMSGCYWMPYRQLAQKGYLEDLWPYIENDPTLGREGVLEAPLKAAEVNGGLYMLFKEVGISTLVGKKSIVGDRCGWTMEEFMEAFSRMPPDSTVFRYDTTQNKVFFSLFAPTLDRYIDWEAGQCSFDNEDFRGMVEFLKYFPSEFKTSLTPEDVLKEATWREFDGLQMLESVTLRELGFIGYHRTHFNCDTAYIGYPTTDGSYGGSFVLYGNALGMSSTCRYKDAAWEYMRQLIQWSNYRNPPAMKKAIEYSKMRICINAKDYRMALKAALLEDSAIRYVRSTYPNGPSFWGPLPSEDDIPLYEYLINNTTELYWPDDALADVVWDAIGPYLAGDRSMDDTIEQVQRRVALYVNEQM